VLHRWIKQYHKAAHAKVISWHREMWCGQCRQILMDERVRFSGSAMATATRQPPTPSLPHPYLLPFPCMISLTPWSILYLIHASYKRPYSAFHLSSKDVGLQAFPSSPTRLQQRVDLRRTERQLVSNKPSTCGKHVRWRHAMLRIRQDAFEDIYLAYIGHKRGFLLIAFCYRLSPSQKEPHA